MHARGPLDKLEGSRGGAGTWSREGGGCLESRRRDARGTPHVAAPGPQYSKDSASIAALASEQR